MKKFILFMSVFLFLSQAFAATVEIENYTAPELKQSLLKYFVKNGLRIDDVTDYSMTTKQNKNLFWQDVLLSSNFNSKTELRTYYNFVQDGKNTIINANVVLVTNPNSAFEIITPLNEFNSQLVLEKLKRLIQGYYGYGFEYKKKRNYILVKNVLPSCRDNVDIHTGNRIIAINDIKIKDLSKMDIDKKFDVNKSNEVLNLKILNGKEIKDITIKSYFIEPVIKK